MQTYVQNGVIVVVVPGTVLIETGTL